ncbi:MAG: signal peptidase II [Reinekea sp.]|jgi:signal peptidase II
MKGQIKSRLWVVLPVLFLGVLFDQLTKVWAVSTLKGGPRYTFLSDTIRIAYAENHGAFLGLGNSLTPQTRFWVLTVAVGLFLLGLLLYVFVAKQVDRTSQLALSFIFVGGFSNFIDRAFNNGAVVDFMNVGVGNLRTGIFNVADVYIMIGAFLIIVGQWLFERHNRNTMAE